MKTVDCRHGGFPITRQRCLCTCSLCDCFLIFSLHFDYPAKGIFLISVLSHQLHCPRLPHMKRPAKQKGTLLEMGGGWEPDAAAFSAGYLGVTLRGLLSRFMLAGPPHYQMNRVGLFWAFSFCPQSMLDVLNGLHGSEWLTCGMIMKFWKWIPTEKQKNCRPCRTRGCWEHIPWCKRITTTLNLDLLNKGDRK